MNESGWSRFAGLAKEAMVALSRKATRLCSIDAVAGVGMWWPAERKEYVLRPLGSTALACSLTAPHPVVSELGHEPDKGLLAPLISI
jgi:hypothetical protein